MRVYEILVPSLSKNWMESCLDRLSQHARIKRYVASRSHMRLYSRGTLAEYTPFDIREAADMVRMGLYDGIIVSSPSVMERLDSWERVRRYLSEQGIPVVYASHVVEEG